MLVFNKRYHVLIRCFYEVQMQHLSHQLPLTITDRKDRIVSLRIEIIYRSGSGSSALLKWWKRCLRHRFPVLESDHLSPTPWWISQHTLLFSAKSWGHNAVAPRNVAQFVSSALPARSSFHGDLHRASDEELTTGSILLERDLMAAFE